MARVGFSTALAVMWFILGSSPPVQAQESRCSLVTRTSLSRCVLEASPQVRSASVEREVFSARLRAASPWLPSNPVLSLSLGTRRNEADPRATNWYATLSQEFEIGGQRSARRASAEADMAASGQRLQIVRRTAVVAAWRAYFDVLAAQEEVALARRLETLSATIAGATQIMAERGTVAGLDADLADVGAARTKQTRLAAEGRLNSARATLASLLAQPVEQLQVTGELVPLHDVVARAHRASEAQRPELGVLEWEARSFDSRARLFERQRIPNLTLSAFAQNDGFNERVLGLGLAMPLPLPFPLGRTYGGEIAEARASARLARAEVTRVQTDLRREVSLALVEYESRVAEGDVLSAEKYARAEATLVTLAAEIKAGKLAPRDAFVAQQTLTELLLGRVHARRAVCLASIELARAAGLSLEEEAT